MRRFFSLLCSITAVLLLAACDNNASGSIDENDNFMSNSTVISADESSGQFEIIGTPLDSADWKDFSYETLYEKVKENLGNDEELAKVFGELGNDEISEKYYRAKALYLTFVNKNLTEWEDVKNPAEIKTESGSFFEKGVTYDSFYNAMCDDFVESSVKIMLEKNPYFYSYNGELYMKGIGAGGSDSRVYREYEIIVNSDSEVQFNTVNYCINPDNVIVEYDEARKSEYIQERIPNRFIKTDNGWRAVEIDGFFGDKSSLSD